MGKERGQTYWISKRTKIQKYSVENHDAGGLEWVGVDDVAACYGVADLDSGGDCFIRLVNWVRGGLKGSMVVGRRKSGRKGGGWLYLHKKNATCPTIQW